MTSEPPHILSAVDDVMNDITAMGKDGFNKQQGFPFRSYDGLMNVVGPVFRKHQVAPLIEVTSMERRSYETSKGTSMMETLVRVTYSLDSLVDGSSRILAKDIPGESADAGDKSASKAVTVACRIALIHGLAIPTQEPDPDEQVYEQGPTRRGEEPPQPMTKDQADLMSAVTVKLTEDQKKTLNDWYKGLQLPKKQNLSEEQADRVLAKMAEIMRATEAEAAGVDPDTGEVIVDPIDARLDGSDDLNEPF